MVENADFRNVGVESLIEEVKYRVIEFWGDFVSDQALHHLSASSFQDGYKPS